MAWDGSLSPPCIFKPPSAASGPAFERMKCSVLLGGIKVWPKYNLVYFGMDEWGCLAAAWRVVCGGNGDPGRVLLVPGADGKVFCSRTNSFLFFQQVLALKVLKVWWSSGKGIRWRHVLALSLPSWTLGLLFPSQRPGSGCRTLEQLVLFSLCIFHRYQEQSWSWRSCSLQGFLRAESWHGLECTGYVGRRRTFCCNSSCI